MTATVDISKRHDASQSRNCTAVLFLKSQIFHIAFIYMYMEFVLLIIVQVRQAVICDSHHIFSLRIEETDNYIQGSAPAYVLYFRVNTIKLSVLARLINCEGIC